MSRKPLTLKAKVAAFMENALCPKCFKPYAGKVEFDHEIPLGAGGKDHDQVALVPLCKPCHALKTSADAKRIAKTRRQAGLTGQQARRKRKGPTMKSRGFDKRYKKKMDGTVERRTD